MIGHACIASITIKNDIEMIIIKSKFKIVIFEGSEMQVDRNISFVGNVLSDKLSGETQVFTVPFFTRSLLKYFTINVLNEWV